MTEVLILTLISSIIAIPFLYRMNAPIYFYPILLLLFVGVDYGTFKAPVVYATSDYEVWNGSISDKQNIVKNCQSGWNSSQDDFCTEYQTKEVYDGQSCSGTGKDRTCTAQYHTEYKYIYPWESKWYLFSQNLKTDWQIKRIDRQGVQSPPLYTATNVGDPASITNQYTNWVRAASDSVFHDDGAKEDKYTDMIPDYPLHLHDIFMIDRVIPVGVTIDDLKKYNSLLSATLSDLGPQKQMNAIVVLVDANKASSDYAYAVRRAWKGFKKNDAVVFIGLKDKDLAWAEVLSWSKDSIFNISLREDLNEMRDKPIDLNQVMTYIHNEGMTHYVRREMAEFEFLKDQIEIPLWAYALAIVLNAIMLTLALFILGKIDAGKVSGGFRNRSFRL